MLKLFNTLSRKLELFKPLKLKKVRMYSCGPTVYNYVHLGNLRAYIFVDLLKRYLRYRGFVVKHVMNITDVDDKTIRDSKKNNKSLKEFTDFYLNAFLEDLKLMNVELPDIMPRATEHINEMVALIKQLLDKGYAYKANGSIYYKISKCLNYGKLAQINRQDLKKGAGRKLVTSDDYKKEEVNDFVLWKAWQPEDGNVFWDTKIGRGRPGWHIECSAMSMKYLGKSFDIHTGGTDLIFPHHTNEIAQSEAVTGKKFVKYWLHNAHLIVDGKKMSKSLNNFYTLRDVLKKEYNPLILRLILLRTHYQQILNFSFKEFKEARSIFKNFLDFLLDLDLITNKNQEGLNIDEKIIKNRNAFKKAMDNDLNISLALAIIFDFIKDLNKNIKLLDIKQVKTIKQYIFEIDSVFGFISPLYKQYQKDINKLLKNAKIKELLDKRKKMRKDGNYKRADEIRDMLLKKGLVVNDTEEGYNVRLLHFP